jgi:hypothetical protein
MSTRGSDNRPLPHDDPRAATDLNFLDTQQEVRKVKDARHAADLARAERERRRHQPRPSAPLSTAEEAALLEREALELQVIVAAASPERRLEAVQARRATLQARLTIVAEAQATLVTLAKQVYTESLRDRTEEHPSRAASFISDCLKVFPADFDPRRRELDGLLMSLGSVIADRRRAAKSGPGQRHPLAANDRPWRHLIAIACDQFTTVDEARAVLDAPLEVLPKAAVAAASVSGDTLGAIRAMVSRVLSR